MIALQSLMISHSRYTIEIRTLFSDGGFVTGVLIVRLKKLKLEPSPWNGLVSSLYPLHTCLLYVTSSFLYVISSLFFLIHFFFSSICSIISSFFLPSWRHPPLGLGLTYYGFGIFYPLPTKILWWLDEEAWACSSIL